MAAPNAIAATPPPLVTNNGHGDHASTGGTAPFSGLLSQAISQSAAGAGHGAHGMGATPLGGGSMTVASSLASLGPAHPAHFPIGNGGHGQQHDLQEVALGLRIYRQQMIASNIANADTPNYKATDIDFREALRIAQSAARSAPLALAATAQGHVAGQANLAPMDYPVLHHVPAQMSADGNTVEMDVERAKFADNAVMVEFGIDRVKGHSMMMLEMLKNLR